jgi:hypothetical protein
MFRPLLLAVLVATAPQLLFAQAAGVPVSGFPDWKERWLHQRINRARVDPQRELAACKNCPDAGCYSPAAPLQWSEELNRAARFHSENQQALGYIAHTSKCSLVPTINTLYPYACNGSAECACITGTLSCPNGGCTKWFERTALFGAFASYEIIASPDDPEFAYLMWMFEGATSAECRFSNLNGHRWAMLKADGSMGAGVAGPSVVDFGAGGDPPAKIASGAHYPNGGSRVELSANWYDAAAPRSASVVIDGQCKPLALERGTATNGTWKTEALNLDGSCHSYYFVFVDAGGTSFTYPAVGSYVIGDCADWTPQRSASSCSSARRRARPVRR